ncbi:UDP-N-acetylmuramate dehydrogenase [Candidatus Omnitrophota bacterium]
MSYYRELKQLVKATIKAREPLSKHTSFRIGGPAQLWVEPADEGALQKLLRFAQAKRIPVSIIGAGSNMLIKDTGIRGIVISLSAAPFKKIEQKGKRHLVVGSGVHLNRLIAFTAEHSLGGCEFLSGIPATVGGALVMNAGTNSTRRGKRTRNSIGDIVQEVIVMDYSGRVRTLKRNKLQFWYRGSNLSPYIILSAKLHVQPKPSYKIKRELHKYISLRQSTQETRFPSAGCIFKNFEFNTAFSVGNESLSAGWIIEQCGLKGRRVNDAVISRKHANYIINRGSARAEDVMKLMEIIRRTVNKKFRIILNPEIKILG